MRLLVALRSRGVSDMRVLTAMERVDRARFVSPTFVSRAFEDVPLPIARGQTISQPSVVGMMTQALGTKPRDIVLEVGTGTGYQAAILSHLVRRVYTIERHRPLARMARETHEAMGLSNITQIVGDGSHGVPEQAPFDRILVTAATEDPPGPLLAQLRIGGTMIVPVGVSDQVQTLIKVVRTADGYDYEELAAVRFVPLIEGVEHD
ncbi:protein-L-isoaspartate(D-aspartate) O-methyltransferase [uncultured Jannaschia sp.]|uniref:protein-L-isoaspartate(D-aspartate) O-methyltransferase n=1 Tax=uncultured Jannaschia sp. TaxID=293347 RepID=UPI0026107464|nr:protein-L-isoaspartate(D-aspartate) O-methyltransferase [uncultured Jannaschia sp.]